MIFVTYANDKFFPILYFLLESLDLYSEHKILVYTIDNELPENFKFKNIIKQSIIKNDGKHIKANKITIMIDSLNNHDDCIFIDADTIVNYSIDELFDYCKFVNNIPLLSLHPDNIRSVKNADKISDELNVEIKKHWGHSDVIWYNKKCMSFLKETLELMNSHYGVFGDEIAINTLQNKYKLTVSIPHLTPYFEYYDYFVNQNKEKIEEELKKTNVNHVYLHLFHGCKRPKKCKKILQTLIEFNKKNTNSTVYFNYE